MDKPGMFGEMLEKGQQTTVKTVKSVVSDVAGSVSGQLGINKEGSPDANLQSQAKTQKQTQNTSTQSAPSEPSGSQAASTAETMDLVREFYAPSNPNVQKLDPQAKEKDDVQTQAKLTKLRQELHQSEYYDPLIAYEKKKPEQQEESAAEKVEREKKEEQRKKMEFEQKKEKEKQDIATARAQRQVETNRGVAG